METTCTFWSRASALLPSWSPGPLPFFPHDTSAEVTSPGLPSTLISLSSDSLCQYPFMTALPAGALHPLSLLNFLPITCYYTQLCFLCVCHSLIF